MFSVETPLEREYFDKFDCTIFLDFCRYYKWIYQKKITFEDLLKPCYNGDIVGYNLSFLEKKEIDELMKKSIETGNDLLFELCKDKKIVITLQMQREAWKSGQMLEL